MIAADIPVKVSLPFAADAGGGYSRQVPVPSQQPAHPYDASFETGFPPETFVPVGAGGAGPDGRDFNGLLNQVTAWNQWQAAGGPVKYDAAFQTAIGGYPQGAFISAAALGFFWLCLVDNNMTNPDLGGAGWAQYGNIGPATSVGGLLYTLASVAPTDYLLADSSAVLQASYPALYSVIGKKYTTFTVTDHPTGAGFFFLGAVCIVGSTAHAIGVNAARTSIQDYFSTDLVSWTAGAGHTISAAGQLVIAAVYDGASLVAFDTKAGVYSVNPSTGAITTISPSGLALTAIACAVARGSTIIVGGSTTGGTVPAMAYSTDHGATWTSITLPANSAANVASLATDGTNVIAGYDSTYKNHLIYSTTGISGYTDIDLTSLAIDGPGLPNIVQYVNGNFFYLIGEGYNQAISIGGPNAWQAWNLPIESGAGALQFNGVVYTNGVYSMVLDGSGGVVCSTTDFETYCTFPVDNEFGANTTFTIPTYFAALGVWVVVSNKTNGSVASVAPSCNLTTQFQLPNAIFTATPSVLNGTPTGAKGYYSPMGVTTTAPYGNTVESWQPFIYIRVQ
jgi:hypothetical protein